ncbi:family 2 encapsulin nanocompartment cargo protein terpene cyclase [Streptantibioticus ferralitis]|uniref:Terpene synthase n=1 Tax=Streptantibioticus ferralitis TaxID=236510 RepID=A0ABT5Z142_9ACTN|nr:family 2 encapsulin nanocompartment cargo protein terpene cyclase [Streptantibioticus ferralitis]MDF2257281.1 family 2 encapsulin nanocompartment cargo protein terpene cyclase [Streptantibioticus ferralitis]
MSLLSRVSAPAAAHDLANLVAAVLSSLEGAAPRHLPGALGGQQPGRAEESAQSGARRLITGPAGLGTSAARLAVPFATGAPVHGRGPRVRHLSDGPTGLGATALRPRTARRAKGTSSVPELYCPPPVRDDPALGDEVNDQLVDWAADVGIYAGRLDSLRAADFGRLIMLTHPDSDDPDRLLAAGKCALAEWAADDHYCDDESAGAAPELLGSRLVVGYAAVDPAHLPVRYTPDLERAMRADPVLAALRSALEHLARYASWAQVARLRHEIGVLFVAFDGEASWRTAGRTPPVWEYLVARQFNSFLPCITLTDVVGGYELSSAEYAEPRVRRAVTMASTASTLVNDLYSMAKEAGDSAANFNLPQLIAAQENCSLREAVERSVEIHDELVRTFEAEAAALSLTGSPALRRYLAGVWAWLGGNREWHSGTARYNGGDTA